MLVQNSQKRQDQDQRIPKREILLCETAEGRPVCRVLASIYVQTYSNIDIFHRRTFPHTCLRIPQARGYATHVPCWGSAASARPTQSEPTPITRSPPRCPFLRLVWRSGDIRSQSLGSSPDLRCQGTYVRVRAFWQCALGGRINASYPPHLPKFENHLPFVLYAIPPRISSQKCSLAPQRSLLTS